MCLGLEVINQVASSRPMLDLGQGLGESVQASDPKGIGLVLVEKDLTE